VEFVPENGQVLMMIKTEIHSIQVHMNTQHPIVILKEVDGDRYLRIWIGEYEAGQIAMELQHVDVPRPMPYDVMKALISELGGHVERVVIVDLARDVYFARIVIAAADRTVEIDARPSDAIALAVRTEAPILVAESVMTLGSESLDLDDEDPGKPQNTSSFDDSPKISQIDEEQLSIFRDFINTLRADETDSDRSN
jgi:uncharacterized protein